jgi:hypothetical protein
MALAVHQVLDSTVVAVHRGQHLLPMVRMELVVSKVETHLEMAQIQIFNPVVAVVAPEEQVQMELQLVVEQAV